MGSVEGVAGAALIRAGITLVVDRHSLRYLAVTGADGTGLAAAFTGEMALSHATAASAFSAAAHDNSESFIGFVFHNVLQ
jgi:hypothetical protein